MSETLFPLPVLKPVKLKTSWVELFGNKGDATPDERRKRWETWKKLAAKNSEMVEFWSSTEGCHDERGTCKHLDCEWCTLAGLPASINPILTMKHGMIGMACMGAGFELGETK